MSEKCDCGHFGDRHEGEPPYPCYECDCTGYHYVTDQVAQLRAQLAAAETRLEAALRERNQLAKYLIISFKNTDCDRGECGYKHCPTCRALRIAKAALDGKGGEGSNITQAEASQAKRNVWNPSEEELEGE